MVFTYSKILLKYKSGYQIEKVIKDRKVYKIEKGIYSDVPSVHYLAIIIKKYLYRVFTSYSVYHHYLTNVIPKVAQYIVFLKLEIANTSKI